MSPRRFWRNLVHRDRVDRELDEELQQTFALLVDEKIRIGMAPHEARRTARLELGSVESIAGGVRDVRHGARLDSVLQDIRHAWRMLRRAPGFTAVAVAMLACGIGINAMMFTVTNAVLFKGFPLVNKNDRLLYMTTLPRGGVSYADFEEWRAQATSFAQMALVKGTHHTYADPSGFPETYTTTEVSAGTFGLVGQAPMLGRDFSPSDETPGAAPVAILSYGFWERRYGKAPAIVGGTVQVNGTPTTVVGVMPRGFSFPQNQNLWVPLVPTSDVRRPDNYGAGWFVIARLAEGVTVEAARAEMAAIGKRPGRASKDLPVSVDNFHEFFIGPTATAIYKTMWGAVAVVLLIACANLANLLLARAMNRSREISVRIALGAGRSRIIRQLLIESAMLSALGGAFGWWIATWGVRVYASVATGGGLTPDIGGDFFDNVLDYSLDYRVFAYLVAISIGTGVLFGLAPASRLSKLDINATLKDSRGATGGRSKRLSALLVVAEMALAVVLLAGAGVMIRSFLSIYKEYLGFNSANIVSTLFSMPPARYPNAEAKIAFFDRLTTRLETIPGMESVAITQSEPGLASWRDGYELGGASSVDEQRRPLVMGTTIGPGYFRTLGAAVLAGREFNDADGASGPPVVIVTQRFANASWPGQNPLGRQLRLLAGKTPEAWLTVVGVVPGVTRKDSSRQHEIDPWVYVPYRQRPAAGSMWVLGRTRILPSGLATAIRTQVRAIDPALPIQLGPLSLADRLAERYRYRGITGALFLMCAAIALLLASIGLYAVVAHAVSVRTQEIGVRMAIGATARDILALVFRQGMVPLAMGLAIGLAASVGVNRVLKSQLVEVAPADPMTLVVVSVVLILFAMLGCLIPARRAMRVDPMVALRHE